MMGPGMRGPGMSAEAGSTPIAAPLSTFLT